MTALTFVTPELVTLLGISAFYLNVPGIAVTVHGIRPVLAAAAFLLLVGPLVVRLLMRRENVLVDRPLLLIVAFLGALMLSLFAVKDLEAATKWVTTFLVEGLLMYFLVSNLFRTPERLRRGIDVLLTCGAILGGLTFYQEATHSYAQQFSGLAQRNIEYGVDESDELERRSPFREAAKIYVVERAGGPVGEPNRYAQVLIVLLPLAYFRTRAERKRWLRLTIATCGVLILAGALLTYSRGGFVALVVLLALLKAIGAIRLKTLGIFTGAVLVAMIAWAPGYFLRVSTLREVPGLLQGTQTSQTEGVIRSRVTEMLAAWSVFVDYPLLGVGPGQYSPVYSATYMNNPDIAFNRVDRQRRAHTLYFELAAETGAVGLACFLGIVGLIQSRLWRAWRRWRQQREDLAGLAAGFFLSISGYLVSAIFLHLAYQRYYWLLLGMASAALQVLYEEDRRSREEAPLVQEKVA